MATAISLHWRNQGQEIHVTTTAGRYTLCDADKETRDDILKLIFALQDAGQGCGGGWPTVYARGWV